MQCFCGKTALYRIGERGFCTAHHQAALAHLAKFGNPRARHTPHTPTKAHLIHSPTQRELKESLRQELIANPTPAEVALTQLLASHPETRRRYEFQPLLHGYIPDFLHRSAKLILEADGRHHFTTAGRRSDARRTAILSRFGYQVLRFSNSEILSSPDSVLSSILLVQRARLDSMPATLRGNSKKRKR